ncbi:MAG: shikimate dehydrogenase, partial [Bacteroidota bacterium]
LLGDPLAHTLSPGMHNAAFEAAGIDAVYLALPVPPARLEAALRGLRALDFGGGNVTIPHKVAIIPFLDRLTPAAKAIGAVNTLFWQEGLLWGDNTDAPGFASTLEEPPESALILGTGGAAKAVLFALLEKGAEKIFVATRHPGDDPFESHRAFFPRASIELCSYDALEEILPSVELVVNATPVGMREGSPLDESQVALLAPKTLVYDLIYNPPETKLLALAKKRGLPVRNGAGMLARQAAIASQRWTGQFLPELFERKLAELL